MSSISVTPGAPPHRRHRGASATADRPAGRVALLARAAAAVCAAAGVAALGVAPAHADGSDAATARSATGQEGQILTVDPAVGLDPAGAAVTVTGQGYDEAVGIYVALCVTQAPGVAPSPCVGGAATEGSTSSAWISSDPPPYAVGLTTPFGAGGTFSVQLDLVGGDDLVDCFDPDTTCAVVSRADHTQGGDRSADVVVPVHFDGQTPPSTSSTTTSTTTAPDPVVLDRSTVAPGVPITATATGFQPGEQVQAGIEPVPTLDTASGDAEVATGRAAATAVVVGGATAAADGSVAVSFAVPDGVAPGPYVVVLRGVSSGVERHSSPVQVDAAPASSTTSTPTSVDAGPSSTAAAAPVRSTNAGAGTGTSSGSGTATLPATGDHSDVLAAIGLALVAAGAALALGSNRHLRTIDTSEETP